MASPVDVTAIVDAQKINSFHLNLLFWSFLLVVIDGFNIAGVALVAPVLARVWHVANQASFGPVLSANFVGMFVGSLGFGALGDRFGRKAAIVPATLWFGVFTIFCMWAGSLDQLMILRCLAGIGIGGVLPNTIALSAEFAPRRVRATFVVLMFTGITFGASLAGPAAIWLVPRYGWASIFGVGGGASLVLAACLMAFLPESLKFLALHHRHDARIRRIVHALSGSVFPTDAIFTLPEQKRSAFRLADLFLGRLKWITPLLWLLLAINGIVFFFLSTWMPLLIESAGAPIGRAMVAMALFQLGGAFCGITLGPLFDRYGPLLVTLLFAVACPMVAAIGFLASSAAPLFVTVFVAGFTLLGLNGGLSAMSGLIYPTAIRSNGSGWALGVARFGSIFGPLLGGWLIGAHLSLELMYGLAAIPVAVAFVLAAALTKLYRAAYHTYGLASSPELPGSPATVSGRSPAYRDA